MQTKRKKRKDRYKSISLCSCGHFNCDTYHSDSPAHLKIQKRLRDGLCMGCGKKECKCKRKENEDKTTDKR